MLNHKTFFKMVYVKNKTRSKYKCTFFLIRSLVLYGSVFRAGVWAGEWCRAQPCCKQRVPRSLGEDEPSQSFFFICARFQGGRGLVSTAIKLILAIKISSPLLLPPFSRGKPHWMSWWMYCSAGEAIAGSFPCPQHSPIRRYHSFLSKSRKCTLQFVWCLIKC